MGGLRREIWREWKENGDGVVAVETGGGDGSKTESMMEEERKQKPTTGVDARLTRTSGTKKNATTSVCMLNKRWHTW